MRRFALVVLVMVMTAACGGDDSGESAEDDPTLVPGVTTTVQAPSTVAGTTGPPTDLTLRITDVRLAQNAEEADNGMRVLLPAGVPTVSVAITGLPSPNRAISVCQARELDRRMDAASCRIPADGTPVTLPLGSAASGVEIVQLGPVGTGPNTASTRLDEVTLRYTASSREVNVRFAQIAAGEEGGRPAFALSPSSADGSYRAMLSWGVIAVFGGNLGTGQLELVQGGNVADQARSSADTRLNGRLPTPGGDVAVRVQNVGGAALVTPKLSLLLP